MRSMRRIDDEQAFHERLLRDLDFLEELYAKLASGNAIVDPDEREGIQTSIADFRLYLAVTEGKEWSRAPSRD